MTFSQGLFEAPVSLRHDAVVMLAEHLVGGERAESYRLTPAERWVDSEKLWQG
jgi:hypothetical protein